MPVKILHKKYLLFKVKNCDTFEKDVLKVYTQLFGLVQLSLSNLSYIGSQEDILIFSIGSKYITSLIATVTYYAINNKCEIILLDVCNTLKECRVKYFK